MDIERFKRLSIPKIEAGKMTEVVRDVIKEVETRDQDLYEKVAKDLKPLTEKFDKEIEEISKLREDVNKQVIPYGEQVQRLALPGPSGEVALYRHRNDPHHRNDLRNRNDLNHHRNDPHHRNDTGGHQRNDPRYIGNGIKRTTKTGQQFSACFLSIYIASFLRCVIYLLPHIILQ